MTNINKSSVKNKSFGSKIWANDLLRWVLREILYADIWIHHPYNKVIVAYDIIDQLESKGFWWQAERVRNHLHRWMKTIACTAEGSDTLDQRERVVS